MAAVNNVLHFRIFDDDGKRVVDTDEQRLTGQARQIENLRERLKSLWPPHELTRSNKHRVTTAVTSIVGYTRPVPRGQHPKHHGCVQAKFVIADDLSKALKFGLFCEAGKRYPAYIRFSNAPVQDDQRPGGHGMAIKLMGVLGKKLLPGEEHAETHDFLLLDSPVFFIKNAIEFASFDAALLAREKSWLGLLSLAGYFATHIWEALILKRISSKISTNPLETKYWSATPYKLGDGAVKYFARPRLDGRPPIAAETPSVDQFRHAMKRNLETRDATFDFFVQRQVDPVNTPIEDATHNWDESVSSYEKVATIHIWRQKFDSDAQMEFCQNLAYNPWHALSDHRPLGGINRARKAVYVALSAMRHKLNNVSYQEPNPETVPTE